MKRLNNFLDKAPLWKVFLLGWLFAGLFSMFVWWVLESLSGHNSKLEVLIKFGFAFGFMVGGLMFTLMTSMMRKSQKFWEFANKIETLVEEAKTKVEIENIFKNEFSTLRSMSLGNPHTWELKRLYAIMETKHKIIN